MNINKGFSITENSNLVVSLDLTIFDGATFWIDRVVSPTLTVPAVKITKNSHVLAECSNLGWGWTTMESIHSQNRRRMNRSLDKVLVAIPKAETISN